MQKTICDRCGNDVFTKDRPVQGNKGVRIKIEYQGFAIGPAAPYVPGPYDLCEPCANIILDEIKSPMIPPIAGK